ncbi:MAG: 4Fe-4S dicluster domain-containing protein [Candidatus Hodarchaeota archaeon]
MDYAVLVDVTKCIGCRGCQVACKRWNELKGESTVQNSEWTNPPTLSYDTYTHIRFNLEYNQGTNTTAWRFLNWRCMHCHNPACLAACPVNAIVKTDEGAVVIQTEKCIGCKFCISACPFGVPQYNGELEKVSKCHMCFDRIQDGKEPACVQACPTDALVFDQRSKIVDLATQRKTQLNGHIYGDVDNKPLGGTSFIYVADVELQSLGIPDVGEQTSLDIPMMVNSKLLLIPAAIGGLFYLAAWRKKRMEGE